ncbi:MAG TPA: hypothetical protein VKS21_00550, partial [Spirochaetota bacterium]|nr:hypothetical protein [Spirochaetota bacterium]
KVGNHRGTQLGIHGFTISKNCENPEAAWSFLKFTTSEEIQTLIGAIQINLPVNPAVNKKMLNSDIDAFQKESLRVGVNSLKFAKTLKCKGNISQTEFYDIIKRNIEHCFKNGSGISPEAALSHAAKEINEKL